MNGSQPLVEWASVVTIRSFAVACTTTPPPSTESIPVEERGICTLTVVASTESNPPVIPVDHFSEFTRLKRITAWILRFVDNACSLVSKGSISPQLKTIG